MFVFYLFLILVIIIGGVKYTRGSFNPEYISVQQTNVIKGIFIWLVFIGHIMPYIYTIVPFDNFIDKAGTSIVSYLNQLVVVPFLFYSGFGVMYSIKKKGVSYVESIPKKRILVTMLNFGVAVTLFVALNLFLNIHMNLQQVLLSYVCWDTVGNSNWYILTICFCYFSSYLSYKVYGYSKRTLVLNVIILTTYIIILSRFKGSWWYNTCLAYSAGCIFCFYKEKVGSFFINHYALSLLVVGALLIISYLANIIVPIANYLFMNICSVFFAVFLLLLTMKFQLSSKLLEWSGKNLFPLYIYQRIPMIFFSTIAGGSLVVENKYCYVLICVITSILIVKSYKYIIVKL